MSSHANENRPTWSRNGTYSMRSSAPEWWLRRYQYIVLFKHCDFLLHFYIVHKNERFWARFQLKSKNCYWKKTSQMPRPQNLTFKKIIRKTSQMPPRFWSKIRKNRRLRGHLAIIGYVLVRCPLKTRFFRNFDTKTRGASDWGGIWLF